MISMGLMVVRLLRAIARSWSTRHFKSALILVIGILLSGTIFYRSVEGWSWIDSLYFCVMTMSTVGLGDLAPQTTFGKLFTVIYIFAGVGVFVVLFAQFARALLRLDEDDEER